MESQNIKNLRTFRVSEIFLFLNFYKLNPKQILMTKFSFMLS